MLWSIVILLAYISWRFEFRFAIGAIAALVHDVLITLGIFAVLSKEINLPTVAAFLTIIGYSLNDTIVVFDRIRENSQSLRGTDYTTVLKPKYQPIAQPDGYYLFDNPLCCAGYLYHHDFG